MAYSDQSGDTLRQIRDCCDVLEERKAEEILVLDMKGISTVTDYFVIVTGKSVPQLRAMRDSVLQGLKRSGVSVIGVDAVPQSGWIVIDVFDFIVHLFLPEPRSHYSLETLWGDAEVVKLEEAAEV